MCGELVAANEISREVKIKVVILGGDRPRPRSEQSWDIVAAELNGNLLFINFYETVGKVTITVKNSYGQIVCSHPLIFTSRLISLAATSSPHARKLRNIRRIILFIFLCLY